MIKNKNFNFNIPSIPPKYTLNEIKTSIAYREKQFTMYFLFFRKKKFNKIHYFFKKTKKKFKQISYLNALLENPEILECFTFRHFLQLSFDLEKEEKDETILIMQYNEHKKSVIMDENNINYNNREMKVSDIYSYDQQMKRSRVTSEKIDKLNSGFRAA